jgi:hypothetical protein
MTGEEARFPNDRDFTFGDRRPDEEQGGPTRHQRSATRALALSNPRLGSTAEEPKVC